MTDRPRETTCLKNKKDDDVTCEKAAPVADSIDVIMEDGIVDVRAAKDPGQLEDIMSGIKKSLDCVLQDDEVSKDYCVRLLLEPDDIFLLGEIQRSAPNSKLRLFANIYGYEQGIKSLTS